MKKIVAVAFAVSTLLRPGLILCMESTGDVRVELQGAFCCALERATVDVAIDSKPERDCEGCVDVSLSTHSLAFKRVSQPAPTTSVAYVLPVALEGPRASSPALCSTGAPHGIHSLILFTTVIRR